ncbi:MAG: radical SAM family heme chaperone HemW [Elusimicrobiota bacterium]
MGDTVGLYVHIPFCSAKCFYCDFASFAGKKKSAGRYLEALSREAEAASRKIFDTLYIGGGTPSELDASDIDRLFSLLHRAYPYSRFSEVTFEANPDSLTEEKLEVLKRWGVTRLSIGLQTTDPELLRAIGRRHSPADFFSVFSAARAAGSWAISVDLMYGLPGQNLAAHRRSLEDVLALNPEHLSLYGLHVEDKTLFGRRGVKTDENSEREMHEMSLDLISSAGLRRYEISNFARPGLESRHNKNYWLGGEYVGIGCGAASYVDGRRTSNLDGLEAYCARIESGARPEVFSEKLSGKGKIGEKILLGLRLAEGLEPGEEGLLEFDREWRDLESLGLIERQGQRAFLSREGVFLANEAFMRFVAPFDSGGSGMA